MEMLLVGLGGCTGMDVISILRKLRQHVTGYEVRLRGERASEHPKVFTAIVVDQEQLKTLFAEQLDRRVRLRVLTRPPTRLDIPGQQLCASCDEAEPFARELATLSDKLEVAVHDIQAEPAVAQQYRVDGTLPVILLEPVTDDDAPGAGAIRFLGLPAGYESSTLVADLVDVSN